MYLKSQYNINENIVARYSKQAVDRADTSSEREKLATKVERDSIDIKKAEYMQDKIGEQHPGVISSITPFGMFVELENTIEGLIRFENMEGDYYYYNEERKILVGEKTKKTFKIGDELMIEVVNADKESRRIDFKMV